MAPKRKFGEIPEWAKQGPITVQNYDLRAEWYGATIRKWGDSWPFLSHDPEVKSTAEEGIWDRYFRDHLGGFPKAYQLFRDGIIRYFNVPEAQPEVFDPSYEPGSAKVIPFQARD